MTPIPHFIGVDIGATQMRLAVVGPDGAVRHWTALATESGLGWEQALRRLIEALQSLREQEPVPGIGVAVAGGVDVRRGLVTQAPNIPMEPDYPLGRAVADASGLPVRLINDANAFALGESWVGAGAGMSSMIGITLGSGVGGGIVAEGRLVEGAEGLAGEIGHLTVGDLSLSCACGGRGCLETLAGGLAIARRYEHLTGQALDAAGVFRRASESDADAAKVVNEAAVGLGQGLTSLVNLFNPEAIVVGGSVSAAWDQLVMPAERWMRQHAFRRSAQACRILPAALPSGQSGVIGAARASALAHFNPSSKAAESGAP